MSFAPKLVLTVLLARGSTALLIWPWMPLATTPSWTSTPSGHYGPGGAWVSVAGPPSAGAMVEVAYACTTAPKLGVTN